MDNVFCKDCEKEGKTTRARIFIHEKDHILYLCSEHYKKRKGMLEVIIWK
jgi:RNase P subunit RPR2